MDNNHTQHQNSTSASGDLDEKLQEEEGEKLNHDGQAGSNNLEGEPVDTDHESVSVVQGKNKKETSVPFWRLVTVHAIK